MNADSKNAIDMLLAESFKELAVTKAIEKITIKEITDKAGVIRPTFYNHFQDKYELLEWIVKTELVEPTGNLIRSGMLKEGLTVGLKELHKSKKFYAAAVRLEGQNSFYEVLQQNIGNMFRLIIGANNVELPYQWLTVDRLIDVYAQSLSYVVTEWIKDDMNVPEEELVDSVLYVINHSSVDMFKDIM